MDSTSAVKVATPAVASVDNGTRNVKGLVMEKVNESEVVAPVAADNVAVEEMAASHGAETGAQSKESTMVKTNESEVVAPVAAQQSTDLNGTEALLQRWREAREAHPPADDEPLSEDDKIAKELAESQYRRARADGATAQTETWVRAHDIVNGKLHRGGTYKNLDRYALEVLGVSSRQLRYEAKAYGVHRNLNPGSDICRPVDSVKAALLFEKLTDPEQQRQAYDTGVDIARERHTNHLEPSTIREAINRVAAENGAPMPYTKPSKATANWYVAQVNPVAANAEFDPHTGEDRLAPALTANGIKAFGKLPTSTSDADADHNVRVGGRADPLDNRIKPDDVERMMVACAKREDLIFNFETRNPERYPGLQAPHNVVFGVAVYNQDLLNRAIAVFRKVKEATPWRTTFIRVANYDTPLVFPDGALAGTDWVILGAPTAVGSGKVGQPSWDRLEGLIRQLIDWGCPYFAEPGLVIRPDAFPGVRGVNQ
jgi:hypothetical protein